jgi:signal transduction histidine kinase
MMSDAALPRVLIVDDDPGLVRLVEKTLKREGFVTISAGSGQEAMAWLVRNDAALMLLDLKLQDIEAGQLISSLADAGRSLPFIIITGQGDERVAVDMMKRGALDYLVKDAQFIEFVPAVVRRALDQVEKDRRLATAQMALKESQQQLLAISERERKRFGAELHDGLGQQLTAIELRCHSLIQDLPASRPDLEKQISQICQFLREAVSQTRSLASDLSPANLGSSGLAEALGELAARMSAGGRIECALDLPATVVVDDIPVAGHLFRIAQEAVNNAVKHSGAANVFIRLSNNEGVLRLEVSDNGKGLPETPRQDQGIGLQIMKYRASLIGAELDILSGNGKGVTVTCVWPGKN